MHVGQYIGRPLRIVYLALLVCVSFTPARLSAGQSLAEMYRSARFQEQAQELLKTYRAHAMAPVGLPYTSDSLQEAIERWLPKTNAKATRLSPAFELSDVRVIRKLERGSFVKSFKATQWAYLGNNARTVLDTTYTEVIRAQLQTTFGSPTQTAADLDRPADGRTEDEVVQFEYWFVLNDSIPLIVMDVNGPFDRGVVVIGDRQYGPMLPAIKSALLEPITHIRDLTAYVDYYYSPEQNSWYLAGYDGERYFRKPIARPDLKVGRPLLDRVTR